MAEKITSILEEENANQINIHDEVIQTITAHAVAETEGVSLATTLAEGIVEKLVKKNSYKAVRVDYEDDQLVLEVHVAVVYGVKIPDICSILQENIIKSIENVTDMVVKTVNIHVDNVLMEKEEAAEKTASTEEK